MRYFNSAKQLRKHIATLSLPEIQYFFSHAYGGGDHINEHLDECDLMNHSKNPNIGEGPTGDTKGSYAIKDIGAGEELLEDYRTYILIPWFEAMAKEYGVETNKITGKRFD
jgi:SET domain-containing protein